MAERAKLRSYGVEDVEIVPLGVELGDFGPSRRDPKLRRSLGLADEQPLLIYVGRLDAEKKPHIVVEAFRKLARELGARLVLLGEGPLREEIAALGDPRILTPGFVRDRQRARALAGERRHLCVGNGRRDLRRVDRRGAGFGLAGRRRRRRSDDRPCHGAIGRLGPVDDSDAMAANILVGVECRTGADERDRRRPKRVNIAGTAAWKRCSASFTARPSPRVPSG